MLEEKAVDILNKLERLTENYAPDVMNVASQTISMKGIASLISGILSFCAIYLVWFINKKIIKFINEQENVIGNCDYELLRMIAITISCVLCVVLLIIGFVNLLDPWNWIACFNPELYFTKNILGI